MGKCGDAERIWIGPRLLDVTQTILEKKAEREKQAAAWAAYQEASKALFILGEQGN
jgi:hypothetical protein